LNKSFDDGVETLHNLSPVLSLQESFDDNKMR